MSDKPTEFHFATGGHDGEVYPTAAQAGIPCAVVQGNKIFKGYFAKQPPIGLLQDFLGMKDQVCKGMYFVPARIVATYKSSNKILYEGSIRAKIIAQFMGGCIYDEHWKLLGSYRGSDSGRPLAMAYLLGLLD